MKDSNVFYDEETEAVIGVFRGFLNSEKFKKIGEDLHLALKEHKACKQLNNIENMKVLTQDVQHWVNNTWFAQATKNGLKYLAFVVPKDIFGKVSMQSANADWTGSNGVEIEYFNNIEVAKEWLRSKS
ncbi:MAG: hypothetical protein N4A72_06200 [Bacteroidales bacterium]|jgi:hypothetical protein|nr:hypothetical protein [Bacteroidales bacterium]